MREAEPACVANGLRSLADLPGPRRLPWLGNFLQLDRASAHRTLEAWTAQYGPYYRFFLGRREMLVVADPAAIMQVLRDRPDGFRRPELLEAIFAECGFNGVFAASGEAWRSQRKMVMAAFGPQHLRAYFASLVRVTERLYRRWCKHASSGKAFDLQADLMRFTVDAVAGLAFGMDFNTIESEQETIQTHLNVIFPMLNRRLAAPVKYWRWFKLPSDRTFDRHLVEVHRAIAELIAQSRDRMAREPALRDAPSNLLEAMLVACDQPGAGLTQYDVASNVLTMLLAGEDTTANTIAWLVYLVNRTAGVARRLSDEADRVLGEAAFAGRLELAPAHTYAAACAQETMRLKPVAPMLILEALRPTVIGDIAVPAGTSVMALMRSGAIDGAHFERPDAFSPDRWLDGQGGAVGSAGRERVSMPFGGGPRICPGRNLATLEISLVTSMLYRNFNVVAVRTPDGAEAKELMAFTMGPTKLMVTLAHRQ